MKKKIFATILLVVVLVSIASQILPFRKSEEGDKKEPVAEKKKIQLANKSGEMEGEAFSNHYGVVQVKIIVENGKISDIKTLIAPGGESAPITDMSVPVLRDDIVSTQSLEVELVSGATETSASYIQSVRSAIESFNANK